MNIGTLQQAMWKTQKLHEEIAGKKPQGSEARAAKKQEKIAEESLEATRSAERNMGRVSSLISNMIDRLPGSSNKTEALGDSAQQLETMLKGVATKEVQVYNDNIREIVQKEGKLREIGDIESMMSRVNLALEKNRKVDGDSGDRVLDRDHPLYGKTIGEMVNMITEGSRELLDGLNHKQDR